MIKKGVHSYLEIKVSLYIYAYKQIIPIRTDWTEFYRVDFRVRPLYVDGLRLWNVSTLFIPWRQIRGQDIEDVFKQTLFGRRVCFKYTQSCLVSSSSLQNVLSNWKPISRNELLKATVVTSFVQFILNIDKYNQTMPSIVYIQQTTAYIEVLYEQVCQRLDITGFDHSLYE